MVNQALGVTITRIALGMILFAHGYFLKVETFTIDGTVGFFSRASDFPQSLHTWLSRVKSLEASP